ncbi:MAG: hypothetical protein LBF90_01060 [Prevotellaceae bacterium]|jgi:hypothetical protein|nr:hypothetical protein [Prevotellaceae bacterium]
MKKVFVTLVALATLGLAASATVVVIEATTVATEEPTAVKATSDDFPQAVKDALLKDYPECTLQKVSYNETEKTYTIEILPKGETEPLSVVYKETGEKV